MELLMQCSSKLLIILLILAGCAQTITLQDVLPHAPDDFRNFFTEINQQTISTHIERDPEFAIEYIIITDGVTVANFSRSRATDGRLSITLNSVHGQSYSSLYAPVPLPAACNGISLKEHMALEGLESPVYPKANATHVGVGSYRSSILVDTQTGEAVWSTWGSATSSTYFVHPNKVPRFYQKKLIYASDMLDSWLKAHADYNPQWKPEIIKLHACFKDILSQ